MIISRGTPTLFVTINPSDVDHPLVKLFAGHDIHIDNISWGEELSEWQRKLFAAKHPASCALFFHYIMTKFVRIILRHGREGRGLYGRCTGYYGTVEAQGKGTLHCHMLIWLQGHLSLQTLHNRMKGSTSYKDSVFRWLESVIQGEFPGLLSSRDQLASFSKPSLIRPVFGQG